MMLASTRWTSTRAGSSSFAPFALNGISVQNPPQLQAQWDVFLKDFDKYYNTVSVPARQAILKAYQSWQDFYEDKLGGSAGWSMATTAPNITPWIEVLAKAQGILDGEKLRGAQAQAVTNQTASAPAVKLQEENVTAPRALAVGLVGIAILFVVMGAMHEEVV